MGTKRHLASAIDETLSTSLQSGDMFVDAFAGVGTVAERSVGQRDIVLNDTLNFIQCLNRARFTSVDERVPAPAEILRLASEALSHFSNQDESILAQEQTAIRGDWQSFADFNSSILHVGLDPDAATAAKEASCGTGVSHYRLTRLYFSGAYFSVAQANALDALRYAIDETGSHPQLLARWIAAASWLCNSPGHTAQALRVKDDRSAKRIATTFRRDVFRTYEGMSNNVQPLGDRRWRAANSVTGMDARQLIQALPNRPGLVYADPPYTKDQYSRYYHVLETMYKYDYPDSHGIGRYPTGRYRSDYCRPTMAPQAIQDLVSEVHQRGFNFALSYPTPNVAKLDWESINTYLTHRYKTVRRADINAQYSTLGARHSGRNSIQAAEALFIGVGPR